MSNAKVAKIVAADMIRMIEDGSANGKWVAPWDKIAATLPVNATTGRAYTGWNVFALWLAGADAGYSEQKWATFKQWGDAGHAVKKGSKSTKVVFWKMLKKTNATGTEEIFPMMRYYNVFNAAQVEGWTAETVTERVLTKNEIHAQCDAIIAATGAEIRHGGTRACFVPSHDCILMPEFNTFHNTDAYYQTVFHELAHWTGHDSRLNRTFGKRFGDEAYAVEELVAELSAAITCAATGLSTETRLDHAKYVKSWLKKLNDDPSMIITAASKASKASDYIIDGPAVEAEEDQAQAA